MLRITIFTSKYYRLLDESITDKQPISCIDDWGIAKRKCDICPTLKANMGTYPDRVGITFPTPNPCNHATPSGFRTTQQNGINYKS